MKAKVPGSLFYRQSLSSRFNPSWLLMMTISLLIGVGVTVVFLAGLLLKTLRATIVRHTSGFAQTERT